MKKRIFLWLILFVLAPFALSCSLECSHSFDESEIVAAPDCINDGIRLLTCSSCGETVTDPIPATGHAESEWIIAKDPTCISDGISQVFCTVCDELLDSKSIPSVGHTESDFDIVSEAACTADGLRRIYCVTCNEVLKEESVPAVGHTESDFETVSEASCTADGLRQIHCVICNEVLREESVPKLGHSYSSGFCIRCNAYDSDRDNRSFVNNPNGYQLKTVNTTVLSGGSYSLKQGVMGYRVRCVQRYLGEERYKYGKYDKTTASLVKAFQEEHDLSVTGEVDLNTWLAMGFTEEQWTTWDTYVHPSEYTEGMTRSQIIDKFIEIAYTYLGAEYIYGCAGTPEQGGDCSGFVLSCLYGIGINPVGYDSQQHNFNEYNSRLMWTDEHFKDVSLDELQIGDLVFYRGKSGAIIHVAIYIGNNQCIESCNSTVEILSLYKNSMTLAGAKRVLYY